MSAPLFVTLTYIDTGKQTRVNFNLVDTYEAFEGGTMVWIKGMNLHVRQTPEEIDKRVQGRVAGRDDELQDVIAQLKARIPD